MKHSFCGKIFSKANKQFERKMDGKIISGVYSMEIEIAPKIMPDSLKDTGPDISANRSAELRKIGLIIALSGLLIGGVIYAFFPDSPGTDESSLSTQYYKKQEVEVQGLWGNQGSLILGLNKIFSRPSTYSVIIMAISAVAGLACFYMASHIREGVRQGNKDANL